MFLSPSLMNDIITGELTDASRECCVQISIIHQMDNE